MDAADWPRRDPLAHRVAATPDRTAVLDAEADRSYSVREFDASVDRRAAALDRRAGPAPTVALLAETSVAFAETVFAVWRVGGTLVPLNARLTAGELQDQFSRVEPDLLVVGPDRRETAAELGPEAVASLDALRAQNPTVEPAELGRDREWLVLFTSGTTGRPKGVRLTVGNLLASAAASAYRLGVERGDRWLCCLPMYHMGGLAPLVRSTLYGTGVVVQSGFDAGATGQVLREYDATGVSLVPTMLRRLLDGGWEPGGALRFVLLGGAPAGEDLLERALGAGVPVHPTYGMTETASQIATATPEQVAADEGTVGQPLVNTDVTVVGADGTPRETGAVGELVVSGPTVTPGYLDPANTAEAVGERGLHTGDAGYRDSDGRLWVVSRLDDRIVTGGENVDPDEVAAVLRDHPAVAEAAVVGVADPEWGQRVAALVVPVDGADPSVPALETHCREHLAGFKLPRTVAVTERLPRTASGTVDREAVRERLRAAE